LGAAVFVGVGFSVANTLWFTALQAHVPAAALSRVASYDAMGSTVLRPVGYALAGPVGTAVGVRGTLVGAGLLTFALQLATIAVPDVRNLRRHPGEPENGPVAVASSSFSSKD
jgi:hypothetical protein